MMRFQSLLLLGGVLCCSASVRAQDLSACELRLEQAETSQEASVYDECGFNDEGMAWNMWAGWVSQKEMKRALYELCVRWPSHMYSDLYCEKSANLGYAGAIAEQGHRLMKKGLALSAVELYARALQNGGLTDEQEGQVAEYLGMYYLDENGGAYAPAKGIEFLAEASKKRSAVANNMIGYLFYTGEYGQPQKDTKAFEYFWRAILLGCPAAEENIGLFHLVRANQIKRETAQKHMRSLAFSCVGTTSVGSGMLSKPIGCRCDEVRELKVRSEDKPYYLVDVSDDFAVLRDQNGKTINAVVDKHLSDGSVVTEIRKTAVILEKNGQRIVLNLIPDIKCFDYCNKMALSDGTVEDINIKPYRLTFKPQECQDLLYYAPALVDVNLPFVGKTECAGSGVASDDALLQLMRQDDSVKHEENQQPNKTVHTNDVSVDNSMGVSGVIGIPVQTPVQKADALPASVAKPVPVVPKKSRTVKTPRKQLRFTVGKDANQQK